jgi:hypothetical protein
MPQLATLRRAVLILSLASTGLCWGAPQALIVHDGTVGLEASVVTNLTTGLTSAGYTVSTNVGVPSGSLSGYGQIWDIRFNITTPISASDRSAYVTYLAGGGSLFVMGENTGFVARNDSIVALIQAAGGPTLTVTNPINNQTVVYPFTGPTSVNTITFLAGAGVALTPSSGVFATKDTNGAGIAIVFPQGWLANAYAGALIVVFDVNFMDISADADSHALMNNMIAYLASPPPAPPTTTTTTTTTMVPLATTTTSTTVPTGCLAVPAGPTFASIRCGLEALRDATASATALGSLEAKLARALGKALDGTDAARGFCTSGKTTQAKARLRRLSLVVTQYCRGLRSRRAMKIAPFGIREPLASAGDTINSNLKTLGGALHCPVDAE